MQDVRTRIAFYIVTVFHYLDDSLLFLLDENKPEKV